MHQLLQADHTKTATVKINYQMRKKRKRKKKNHKGGEKTKLLSLA